MKEMHRRGINMRHLGLVWVLLNSNALRKLFFTEMSMRIAKSTFRALMREAMEVIQLSTEEPYYRTAVEYINLLFGNTSESQQYWNNEMKQSIIATYSCEEEDLHGDLKSLVDLPKLFQSLIPAIGIRIKPSFFRNLDMKLAFQLKRLLRESDVECIEPKLKDLRFLHYAEAFSLYSRATVSKEEERLQLFGLANQHFAENSLFFLQSSSATGGLISPFTSFSYWSKSLANSSLETFQRYFKDFYQFSEELVRLIYEKKLTLTSKMERELILDVICSSIYLLHRQRANVDSIKQMPSSDRFNLQMSVEENSMSLLHPFILTVLGFNWTDDEDIQGRGKEKEDKQKKKHILLSELQENKHCIQSMNFSKISVGENVLIRCAEIFGSSLRHLELSRTSISAKGLIELVSKCPSLSYLSLSHNQRLKVTQLQIEIKC